MRIRIFRETCFFFASAENGTAVFTDERNRPVEEAAAALGEGGEEDHRAQGKETDFDPAVQVNMAEAENGQHDHQLQVAAADIGNLVSHDGFFQAVSPGVEQETEVDDRNQRKQKRDMDVMVLVPDKHINACQHDGNDKGGKVVSVKHREIPPVSRDHYNTGRGMLDDDLIKRW